MLWAKGWVKTSLGVPLDINQCIILLFAAFSRANYRPGTWGLFFFQPVP
jgi:hypothetical protein